MFDRYRPLLKLPGAWWLLASSLAGRLPLSTNPLAVLLLMRATTHSFSDSGAASGAIAIAQAASAPIVGRMLDRVSLIAIIGPTSVLQVAGMITLVICAESHVPVPILIAICAVIGASMPQVSATARMMWGRLVPTRVLRDAAYALDSTGQEIAWTSGPVIVGALVAGISAQFAALAVTAISFVSVSWFLITAKRLGLSVSSDNKDKPRGSALSIRDPRTATMVAVGMIFGIGLGALEVGFPALAEKLGATALSGILLALWSGGSMIGGIVYGTRHWSVRMERMLMCLFLLNAILVIPVAFALNVPWAVGGCMIAGLCSAPILATMASLIADNTPSSAVGEAFTWNTASIVSGIAIGSAVSGLLVSNVSVTTAIFLGVVASFSASAVAFLSRHKFRSGKTGEMNVVPEAEGGLLAVALEHSPELEDSCR
jgi:predicted MFS family arabinose efflux permease